MHRQTCVIINGWCGGWQLLGPATERRDASGAAVQPLPPLRDISAIGNIAIKRYGDILSYCYTRLVPTTPECGQ